MNLSVEIWYHISLFCDNESVLNIVKICKSLYNGCKIVTDDPVCQTKFRFSVICNGETLGSLLATNDSDYAIIKKLVELRFRLPYRGSLDVVSGSMIRTYDCGIYRCGEYYTRDMKYMEPCDRIKITTSNEICYVAVIMGERINTSIIDNYLEIKKHKGLFYYQMYLNGKISGEYRDSKKEAAIKICNKIRNLSKGIPPRSFTIVRKIDNKHFYYDVDDNEIIRKRHIKYYLALK